VCARRFGKIRRGLVKIQAGARGLLAKGERRRREAEDLRETEGALRKGLKADKLDAKGTSRHTRNSTQGVLTRACIGSALSRYPHLLTHRG
jgi:hypothetical protein